MPGDGGRRWLARSAVVTLVVAVLTLLVAPKAFSAGPPRSRPPPRARAPRRPGVAAAAGAQGGPGLLEELLGLAGGAEEEKLAARVDADFGRLTPDDLNALRGRLAAAEEAVRPPLERLTGAIQAAMERRMEQAARDIDALLQSSGDIDENIRGCLARQDSPLPIMAVLQMNLQKARQQGLEKQERALAFVFSKINAELEERVPVANRVLTKLLATAERDERRGFLRGHLAEASAAAATPDGMADAIVQLVADVEERFRGDGAGFGGETREGTLELVRQVALDVGVVVGEVRGEEAQAGFSEQLLPLFEALSK